MTNGQTISICILKMCPLQNLASKKASFLLNRKKQMRFLFIKEWYNCVKKLPTYFITFNMWKNIWMFNIFELFIKNNLKPFNQSGLSKVTHVYIYIYSFYLLVYWFFHNSFQSIFLDISNAFNKVWRKGIIFKLKQIGGSGDALNILISFLKERKQRVVLNGQHSK